MAKQNYPFKNFYTIPRETCIPDDWRVVSEDRIANAVSILEDNYPRKVKKGSIEYPVSPECKVLRRGLTNASQASLEIQAKTKSALRKGIKLVQLTGCNTQFTNSTRRKK